MPANTSNPAAVRLQVDLLGVDSQELISMLSVWRVLLVADGDVTEFYRRLGFEPFGNVMGRFDDTRLLE